MSDMVKLAKIEMLEVLRQIEAHYHSAEEIVLAFRASLDTVDETPDIRQSLQPVMERLTALDRDLSTAYGRWQQGAGPRDQELQTAVDRARNSLTRLFQQIDAAMTSARAQLQQLTPGVAAASTHRQMIQAYGRGSS